MKTKIIFLRHAKTQADPTQHAKEWKLSDLGYQQAIEFVNNQDAAGIDVIYTSDEEKSVLTAKPIAEKLGKEITRIPGLNEVKRGDAFLSDEEFEIEKRRQLENWEYTPSNGESSDEALTRFEKSLKEIEEKNQNKTVLIVSHGTILNLYFAKITGTKNHIFDRWQKSAFCAYGIVENNMVIKDIVS